MTKQVLCLTSQSCFHKISCEKNLSEKEVQEELSEITLYPQNGMDGRTEEQADGSVCLHRCLFCLYTSHF